MSKYDGLDPVSAISEAEATGEIDMIFADIRETMQLLHSEEAMQGWLLVLH